MDGNDSQSGRYASTASVGYVNNSPAHVTYKGDIMGELYIDGLPASERALMPVHMPPVQSAREHKRHFFSKKRVSPADSTEEVTAIYPTEVVPVVVDKPEKRDDGTDLFVHDELAARRAQRRERQERVTGRLRKIGAAAGAAAVAALLFVGVGNTNRDEERISAQVPLTEQDVAPAPTTTTTVRSTTTTTIIRGSLNSNHAPITKPAYHAPPTTTTTKKPISPITTATTASPRPSTTGPAPTTTGKPTTSTTRLPVSSTIRPPITRPTNEKPCPSPTTSLPTNNEALKIAQINYAVSVQGANADCNT